MLLSQLLLGESPEASLPPDCRPRSSMPNRRLKEATRLDTRFFVMSLRLRRLERACWGSFQGRLGAVFSCEGGGGAWASGRGRVWWRSGALVTLWFFKVCGEPFEFVLGFFLPKEALLESFLSPLTPSPSKNCARALTDMPLLAARLVPRVFDRPHLRPPSPRTWWSRLRSCIDEVMRCCGNAVFRSCGVDAMRR